MCLTIVDQFFRNISSDDTVEVGSDLYELDTEAEATVHASESAAPAATSSGGEKSSPPAPAAPAKAPSPAPAPSKQTQQHRVPSIHFLGKEGWTHKLAGVPELPPVPTNFGRPAFTEEEMEALMMGGANLVPNVKQHSDGAVFGY
jgi:pyruvate/2-oxoglutarate dehydrogenase complex dihydrolipoamide acyltransferase (E2) component